jgi:uncharacterized protein YjiS (DUF1127 family)
MPMVTIDGVVEDCMHTIDHGSTGILGGLSRVTAGGALLAKVVSSVLAAQERLRMRRTLQTLDDRLLRDIGLTRADVWREVRKSAWHD